MKRLGISLYPGKSNENEDIQYIEKAHQYGFTRIFTNLLQLTDENKATLLPVIEKTIRYAKI